MIVAEFKKKYRFHNEFATCLHCAHWKRTPAVESNECLLLRKINQDSGMDRDTFDRTYLKLVFGSGGCNGWEPDPESHQPLELWQEEFK